MWKVKLFGLIERWWDLSEKFVSDVISVIDILIDKTERLKIIKNKY